MASTRSERGPLTRAARLLVGLVLAVPPLSGCDVLPGEAPGPPGPRVADRQVDQRIARVLRIRDRAVLRGDRSAWLATVATGPGARTTAQRRHFANLSQLPWARYRHRLLPDTVVRRGVGWAAVVEVRMRLAGYDAAPVVRRSRHRFVPDLSGPGVLVAAERDRVWERRHEVDLQPWDRGRVVVRRGRGVLGVFDAGSVAVAEEVVAAVERGIEDVAAHVPHRWSRSVVVYALSDTRMLTGLDRLPGSEPDRLDAVALPVSTRPGGERLAAMRFLLHPRMLRAEPDGLARLVRHELTHVALGARDDEVPTWLAEGLAEWVSVRPIPPEQRLLSGAALAAARAGPAGLPPDSTFHGPGSAAHYGLSWWACEVIAATYGEESLWSLLDAMASQGRAPEEVLESRLGLTGAELAAEAARRILATYG